MALVGPLNGDTLCMALALPSFASDAAWCGIRFSIVGARWRTLRARFHGARCSRYVRGSFFGMRARNSDRRDYRIPERPRFLNGRQILRILRRQTINARRLSIRRLAGFRRDDRFVAGSRHYRRVCAELRPDSPNSCLKFSQKSLVCSKCWLTNVSCDIQLVTSLCWQIIDYLDGVRCYTCISFSSFSLSLSLSCIFIILICIFTACMVHRRW